LQSFIQDQDSEKTTSSKFTDISQQISVNHSYSSNQDASSGLPSSLKPFKTLISQSPASTAERAAVETRANPLDLAKKTARSKFHGLVRYQQGLSLQRAELEIVEKGLCDISILGFEHQPVITLGKRAQVTEDISHTLEEISLKGIEILEVPRGGHATLHSPGQLVIYPVVNLNRYKLGVRRYVELLLVVLQSELEQLGIKAKQICGMPGLYTEAGKIAFVGIQVQKGIASHGIAINISNDLNLFSNIRSCGKNQETFDSLQNHGVKISLSELFESFSKKMIFKVANA
jgi:lipoyl(octanoyl) transferase